MSVKLQQYFIKILGIKNNNNKFLVLINPLTHTRTQCKNTQNKK